MPVDLVQGYLPIILFIGVAFVFAVAAVLLSFIFGHFNPYPAKIAAYECGFEPFDDARAPFDVRYYLVAILFILFDLEVAFLLPWAVSLGDLGWSGFFSMMFFLVVLTIAFIYEWRKGALEWE